MSTEIKEFSPIEAAISGLREMYNYLPECTTEEGFTRTKKDYREIRKYEIDLDKKRKELTEGFRTATKKVNDSAKEIDNDLKLISSPFKNAIERKTEELRQAEVKRINGLKDQITEIQSFVFEATGKTSEQIAGIIESVDLIDVNEHFQEFQSQARESLQTTKFRLTEMLTAALEKEVVEKQLAKEREANEVLAKEREAEQEELRLFREEKAAKEATERESFEEPKPEENPIIDGEDAPYEAPKGKSLETKSLLDHIADWGNEWGNSLEAMQELSEILKEHNII